MLRLLWVPALLCVTAVLALGGSWSGVLVDSNCFNSMDHNRGDMPSFVNWDRNAAIEYCSPTRKTHSFGVVQSDGLSVNLNSDGNEKARTLLDNDKNSLYVVKLDGEKDRHMVRVNSISVLRRVRPRGRH